MKISIVFSTFNGAHTLERMLDSLTRVASPHHVDWHILAVNNASTDKSADILASYAQQLPLTTLEQPKPGKNVSLNFAVSQNVGELIVFTDDDVLFDPEFLVGYEALALNESDFDVFGGAILPSWEKIPHPDIPRQIPIDSAYSLTAPEYERGEILAGRIFGPNMAIRRRVFEKGVKFDERYGPTGGKNALGDETDFLQRTEQAGFKAFFDPAVKVQHIIRPWQLEKSWIEDRGFKAGQAFLQRQARLRGSLPDSIMALGYPRWALRKAATHGIQKYMNRLPFVSRKVYQTIWDYGFMKGYLHDWKQFEQTKGTASD